MQFLYANSDPATKARANTLGCGWVPEVPPQFKNIATSPCVILSGAGQTVVIEDDGTPDAAAVAAAAAGIQAAEAAAAQQAATLTANQTTIQQNLAANQAVIQTWITAHPTGATLTAAQTLTVAKMLNALCNLLLAEFGSTSGT